MNIIMLSVAH